ncbi:MAG: hypothetical protein AAF725_01685 [Acidobacteriota bacterium]
MTSLLKTDLRGACALSRPSRAGRTSPPLRLLSLAAGCAALLWAGPATASAEEAGLLRAHGESSALRVEKDAEGWRLITARASQGSSFAADSLRLPLSAAARAERLSAHGESWLLTATTSDGAAAAPRLVILRGTADGTLEQLPSPTAASPVLLRPTVLADERAEPVAALWIEGESFEGTAVRSSRWTGAGWTEAEILSPGGGPGSQLALDAERLDDGSLLAVWSAFDGEDDEILWSLLPAGISAQWTEPRPLSANAVPDVTPTVTAVEGGALVAWSGYRQGHYRIWQRRWSGSEWGEAQSMGGKGSVSPAYTFESLASPVLMFRQTVPSAWRVLQMNADGSTERSASLEPATNSRRPPNLEAVTDAGVVVAAPPAAAATKAEGTLVPWQELPVSERR